MKQQVARKRSTFGNHRNADCLLTNTSIKHSKYVFNQKHQHFEDDRIYTI